MKMKWIGLLLLVFFFTGVYGCNDVEEIVEEIPEEEEPVEEEQEIMLSEEDFTFKIGTLPYRGAVLFINYEGEVNLSDYNLFVDILSDGEIKQEKMPVEEVDGNLTATIVDLMYLPGDELDFVIRIQDESGEGLECRYFEVLESYPWKDWMFDLSESVWVTFDRYPNFKYDWPESHSGLGAHSSWDLQVRRGADVYCGTVGIIFNRFPPAPVVDNLEIYNPYVGAIIQYGHMVPVGGYYSDEIYTGKKVFAGDYIGNVTQIYRHIHYSIIRPYEYSRRGRPGEWYGYYWPIINHNGKYIYNDSYNDPFYWHEPTTLGYWYEETLPRGLKEEMLRMFQKHNPGITLPATEPLEPLN